MPIGFPLGTQELLILGIALVGVLVIFTPAYLIGKGKGFRQGIEYANKLNQKQDEGIK